MKNILCVFCTSYCISCNTRREVPDILIVHLKWYNEWERLVAMLYLISPDIISLFWFFTRSGTVYIIMHIWEIRCTYIMLSLFVIIVLSGTGIKFPGYILGQIQIIWLWNTLPKKKIIFTGVCGVKPCQGFHNC